MHLVRKFGEFLLPPVTDASKQHSLFFADGQNAEAVNALKVLFCREKLRPGHFDPGRKKNLTP